MLIKLVGASADGAQHLIDRRDRHLAGTRSAMQGGPPNTSQVEWPTAVVGVAVYGAWLALLHWHQHLPVAVLVVLLGLLGAFFGSFQHEAIHGHPFRDRRIGDLAAAPPLALWLPYARYRETHLLHHRSALTDPSDDPESWYCDEATWAEASRAKRAVLVLLRYDTLRDRPNRTAAQAGRSALVLALIIPVGFVAVLLVPLWVGLILIAVPAIAVGVMALAS